MTVASLELCKKLYELSGWEDTYENQSWWIINGREVEPTVFDPTQRSDYTLSGNREVCPAYDLGYLLRKLVANSIYPEVRYIDPDNHTEMDLAQWYGKWICALVDIPQYQYSYADTPEDAACKLAIELFKQGVLKREGV